MSSWRFGSDHFPFFLNGWFVGEPAVNLPGCSAEITGIDSLDLLFGKKNTCDGRISTSDLVKAYGDQSCCLFTVRINIPIPSCIKYVWTMTYTIYMCIYIYIWIHPYKGTTELKKSKNQPCSNHGILALEVGRKKSRSFGFLPPFSRTCFDRFRLCFRLGISNPWGHGVNPRETLKLS